MDLNGDGNMDILSGSYSRMDQDMAGLFQVLWGTDEGTFKEAEPLKGTDGELLIIPGGEQEITDKICTRPTAADIDGDGNLDIVVGNFRGTFYVFRGEEQGAFSPKCTKLTSGGTALSVKGHSDPVLVDWDNDGDLDLISGSSAGGVFMSKNEGSATEPKFMPMEELFPAIGHNYGETKLGDSHVTGPQTDTRVWVDDVNEDGKLDILIGDTVRLAYPAEGLDEAGVRKGLEEWQKEQEKVSAEMQKIYAKIEESGEQNQGANEEMQEAQKKFQALWEKRKEIIREDNTGFVWVLYQK